MMLIIVGIIWPRLRLSSGAMKITSWLLIYGAYDSLNPYEGGSDR